MGFENLFFGKAEKKVPEEIQDEEDLDEKGSLRRKLLIGASALFAGQMLNIHGAEATDLPLPEYVPIDSQEAREKNIEKIRAYSSWLIANEEKLSTLTSKAEIEAILLNPPQGIPALSESVLQNTELDLREQLSEKGWLSTLICFNGGQAFSQLQWEEEENKKTFAYKHTANLFSVNNTIISNNHVLKGFPNCVPSSEGYDISGSSIDDPILITDEKARAHLKTTELEWNPEKTIESLHGKIVFIPVTRPDRSGVGVFTELIPAVLCKVTPNWESPASDPDGSFFSTSDSDYFTHELNDSYVAVIAPEDADGNGISNGYDVRGMSGSPVLTLDDCLQGKKMLSGIVWGSFLRNNGEKMISHSLMLIQGPKAVGSFMEQMGVNYNSDQEHYATQENLDTVAIIKGLQEGINVWRKRHNMEPISVDGGYGEETAKALYALKIREFHIKQYPPVVDEQTWDVLFRGAPFEDLNPFLELK